MRTLRTVALLWLMAFMFTGLQSQVQAQTVTLNVQALVQGSTTVLSGQEYTYRLLYSCASVTDNCANLVLTSVIPPELSGTSAQVVLVGNSDVASTNYNSTTRTATWTFKSPLPSGSTGELQVRVRFPNGITPNGTTTTLQATLTGNNANPVTATAPVVTAQASNKYTLQKTVQSGNLVGGQITYRLRFNSENGGMGSLDLNDVILTDMLPAGAVYVSSSNGGVHNGTTVTWPAFNTTGAATVDRTVTVVYPEPTFAAGQSILNQASATGTPVGLGPIMLNTDVTHVLQPPQCTATLGLNTITPGEATVGFSTGMRAQVRNTGNIPLTGYSFTLQVPAQVDFTQFLVRGETAMPVTVRYQTNLDASFRDAPGGPFTNSQTRNVSTLNLQPGEYVTALRYIFNAEVVPGYNQSNYGFNGTVLAVDRNGNAVPTPSTIPNSAQYGFSCGTGGPGGTPGGPGVGGGEGGAGGIGVSRNLSVVPRTAYLNLNKATIGSSTIQPGGEMTYRLRIGSHSYSTDNLVNPSVSDLLDARFVYVAGSANPAPLEVIPNYNGTGQTLLRWQLNETIAPNGFVDITFNVATGLTTPPGTVPNRCWVTDGTTGSGSNRLSGSGAPDAQDLNRDGNTTQTIYSSNTHNATVAAVATMQSRKWVKGSLDPTWNRYPDVGQTVPGGLADYRLVIFNTGNVPMTNIKILDILPWIGDVGVVAAQPRLSEWRPNLIGAVNAPAGITVQYSTANNPCRTDISAGSPAGCVDPNWSPTPPSDVTSVQSLLIDFGAITLASQDSLVLTWPMRAPYGAPSDIVAWNSFGFVATRGDGGGNLLAAEPIKVGIEVNAPVPADYGNYVWEDLNVNGIQDPGEPGINGVRVELVNVGPDGQPGTADDFSARDNLGNVLEFTLTGNDQNGNPGYYVFPFLEPGTYFARVVLPNGYLVSPQNVGSNDEVDSDLHPTTHLIAPRTLAAGQFDYTNDAGLYRLAKYSGIVWYDVDEDGLLDDLEVRREGVTVTLKDGTGATVATTTTNAQGAYAFTDLFPGTYSVCFSGLPRGWGYSDPNVGPDSLKNSHAVPGTGCVPATVLVSGSDFKEANAGIFRDFRADLSLEKLTSDPMPTVGNIVTFTLRVSNAGPSFAENVVVTDYLPTTLTFHNLVSVGSGAVVSDPVLRTLTWSVPEIEAGQHFDFVFHARVDSARGVENIAEITASANPDPDSTPGNGDPTEDDWAAAAISPVEPSSGGSAGVESEGSMATLLAQRMFMRRQDALLQSSILAFPEPIPFEGAAGKTNLSPLADLVPTMGPRESRAAIVTPQDLIGVTNASSVIAVDYLRPEGRRVGAMFGAVSPSGVLYDHAKTTCDRLGGGYIDRLGRLEVSGYPFALTRLVHHTGQVDYAVSFIAYRTATGFNVQSAFSNPQYTPPQGSSEVYNLQVWSAAPEYTAELVQQMLNLLSVQGEISFGPTAAVPQVYVTSGLYENGKMLLGFRNTTGAEVTVPVFGTIGRNETATERETLELEITVPPSSAQAPIQRVILPVGVAFDGQFRVTHSQGIDEIYFADGTWSYFAANSTITRFQTLPDVREEAPSGTRLVERPAVLEGQVRQFASLFRYLRASGLPLDVSSYTELVFNAKGTGQVELVLEKASLSGNQFRTQFTLSPNGREHRIRLADLTRPAGAQGRFSGEDVTLIAFYVLGNAQQTAQPFSIEVSDVRFVGGRPLSGEEGEVPSVLTLSQSYPNPAYGATRIAFGLPTAETVRLTVYDVMGREVTRLADGMFTAGMHEVSIQAGQLPAGTYMYRLEAGGTTLTRMMTIVR